MSESVVIAGSLAQRTGVGGHAWVFLQYLLGFKKLGWKVLFIDHLNADMCANGEDTAAIEHSSNIRYFREAVNRYGLEGEYALLLDDGRRT